MSGLLRVAVVGLLLVLACGCDGQRLRRMAAHCTDDEGCESGVCYRGRCSKACTVDSDCGALFCLDNFCQPVDTPCDDGDVCTVGDSWIDGKCTAGTDKLVCPETTFCQAFSCVAKVGCTSTAAHEGEPCGDGPAPQLCGGGGPQSRGCRCALWQGRTVGPFDGVSSDGKSGGLDVLTGGVGAERGVVAVGYSHAQVGGTAQGWAVRVNGAGQIVWTRAYSAPGIAGGHHRLVKVASAPGGWIAVGVAGAAQGPSGSAWVQRLDGEGQPQSATVVPPPKGFVGADLRDLASASGGGWLAVGSVYNAAGTETAWLVRLDATGKLAWQQTLSPSLAATVTSLAAVTVTADKGWTVVGKADADAWVVRLDALAVPIWQQRVQAQAGVDSGLRGVATTAQGGSAAFGWMRKATGPRVGWLLQVSGNGVVEAQSTTAFGDDAVELVGGVPTAPGQWLVAASLANGTKAWTGIVGSGTLPWQGTSPSQAAGLGAVVAVKDGFVLVGSYAAADGADGWLMRIGADFSTATSQPGGVCQGYKTPAP